jgi:hypothetical protein
VTEPRVLVPTEPRYQNFIAPDYESVQFLDDTGSPINLTGVDPTTGFTFVLASIAATPTIITCTGDWAITDATNGKAKFSFGLEDLAIVALFAVYITVQLPGESTPRAFPFNMLDVQAWNGATLMTTQVDLTKVNGTAINTNNPVPISGPVTSIDGGIATLGLKADASYTGGGGATTHTSLLRGIFDQLAKTATRALIAPYGSNPAQTAASGADTQFKWGASGTTPVLGILMYNGSGADLRYALDAASSAATFILADKQTVFIDVGAPILVLHLSTAAQQYVNHASNAGIVFQAWG